MNVRFKKCKIPITYAKIIPEISLNLNENQFGASKLYERFCIDHRSKEVSIFEENSPRITVVDKTQSYPASAFQRVDCDTQTELSQDDLEMKKELQEQLGLVQLEKHQIRFKLQKEADKRIKIKFNQQPTELELKQRSEIRKGFNSDKLINDEYLLDNVSVGNWANEVIGGYYVMDHLDYSHIQLNEFPDELEEFEMVTESLSREKRPIAWMVLFVWENEYHNEQKKDHVYHDMKLMMNPQNLNFRLKIPTIDSLIRMKKLDLMVEKLKKRGQLSNNRFIFETTKKHEYGSRFKHPLVSDFLKSLRRDYEQMKGKEIENDEMHL